MDNELLVWLKSFDQRVGNIEESIKTINHELGELGGRLDNVPKNNRIAVLLIKYVAFPLIVILGGLAGVRLFLPL